jgi:hypothetical protein
VQKRRTLEAVNIQVIHGPARDESCRLGDVLFQRKEKAMKYIAHEKYLRPIIAAKVIGVSVDYLKGLRKDDRMAIEQGLPIQGPPWRERLLGKRVMVAYKLSELIEWADSFWTASGSSPPSNVADAGGAS